MLKARSQSDEEDLIPPPKIVRRPSNKAAESVSKGEPTTRKPPVWEWKSNANAGDSNPKSWTRYSEEVAQKIEEAFTYDGGRNPTISLDKTYAIAFHEHSLGMIQYRLDDPGRWRAVRRLGPRVDRPNRTTVHLAKRKRDSSDEDEPSSSSSSSLSSEESESSSESSFSESDSSDSEERRKRGRRGGRGKGAVGKGGAPPKKTARFED